MSPFFLRQYVKGHASDVFEAYPQLLTEMVLRLPYQVTAAIYNVIEVFQVSSYKSSADMYAVQSQYNAVKNTSRVHFLY